MPRMLRLLLTCMVLCTGPSGKATCCTTHTSCRLERSPRRMPRRKLSPCPGLMPQHRTRDWACWRSWCRTRQCPMCSFADTRQERRQAHCTQHTHCPRSECIDFGTVQPDKAMCCTHDRSPHAGNIHDCRTSCSCLSLASAPWHLPALRLYCMPRSLACCCTEGTVHPQD